MVADLVQSEQLMLDDPVIELEPARPQEQRTPPAFRDETAPAQRVREQEQPGPYRGEPACVNSPSDTRPTARVDLS